ncbi:3-isopropylmalate dehydratase small subunit [Candidatus Woesearchaeota archaeon]|nr:3-isopropylmalate dehydratase small subunit [Candidatus Woesearchaeota archaeon]
MQPFDRVTGVAVPLNRPDVDTDQIIPKQFLKRIERTGFGQFLFHDWRRRPDGAPDPDFELNRPGYAGATILLAGRNFGCGSSREHAPWALEDYGFRTIIAPSFADIFYNNCFKNGLLPVTLPEATIAELMARATERPGYQLTVDLEQGEVLDEEGGIAPFEVDPFRRHCLLNGLDDVNLTLQQATAITTYEQRRPSHRPVTTPKPAAT